MILAGAISSETGAMRIVGSNGRQDGVCKAPRRALAMKASPAAPPPKSILRRLNRSSTSGRSFTRCSVIRLLPRSTRQQVDLDQRAARRAGDADAGARRQTAGREIGLIDPVHRRIIAL